MFSGRVGQYVGVWSDNVREFPSGHRLRIIAYRAHDAFGLIASEHNGIAVLSESDQRVVCDDIARESSGYCWGTEPQHHHLRKLLRGSPDDVELFLSKHHRTRYKPKLC